MGMEVPGREIAHANGVDKIEESATNLHGEDGEVHSGNGLTEPINLIGSDGVDLTIKAEVDGVSNSYFPKDVAEEWPAAQQVHSFYLVKYRPYDDPIVKPQIDQADREIGKRNQQRFQVLEELKAKRSERAQIIEQLKSLGQERKQYRAVFDEKLNQMKPLKEALGNLRGSNNAGRDKGAALCSNEEELNELIRSLNYRMQHEVISLTEEKQLIRDIKQLEGTREKVIANAAMRAQIQDSMGEKESIQDQVKLIGTDLDGVKKEREVVKSKIKGLEDGLRAIEVDIASLKQELASVSEKRDKAVETIRSLRKQRDERNACFYQNRSMLNNAKELAAKKDVEALRELASAEVEKFMSSWNSSKPFRDDYEKRILVSLDIRQLSRDGRIRNPNEKPLVLAEQMKLAAAETLAKEQEKVPAQNVQKASKPKLGEPKTAYKPHEEDQEEYYIPKLPEKDTSKRDAIDEAKLKEMKRQEELEKQKQALERKKKQAEKAAAKAAIRAQKEAEKKQKEREKKMKKKESGSELPLLQDEATEVEADKPESDDNVESSLASVKAKEAKSTSTTTTTTTTVRNRGQTRGQDALPKAVLKRKKSRRYLYRAAGVVAVLAVLVALLYKYAF